MSKTWATSGVDLFVETVGSRRRASLEDALRGAISSRRLAAGARLPSTRALAADLGFARGTVAAAYDQLVAEGYLVARRGADTRVADIPLVGDDIVRATHDDAPRHDLCPGTTDVSSFPVAAWLRCTRRALSQSLPEAYGYGDPHGRPELRSALVDYLGRTRGVRAAPDQIVVTSGSTQALSLLCAALAACESTTLAMENPGFFFHRDVARRAGQTVLPLDVDAHGALTDRLRALPGDASAVVVTAAHQYPTGVTLHPVRRHALSTWARDTGGLIVEDDYDGEFRYDRHPVGALQGMAPDHVAYIGTASKTLGPGVRLGWIVAPRRLVSDLAEAKLYTDISGDVISQLSFAEMLRSHAYERHIRSMRQRYRRRRDLLVSCFAELEPILGPRAVVGIPGGLQALVRLPGDGPSEAATVAAAAEDGLALEGLSGAWHTPGPHTQGIVVGFSRPPERDYPAALGLLAKALRRALG